jgi:hypothetical protein
MLVKDHMYLRIMQLGFQSIPKRKCTQDNNDKFRSLKVNI